MDDQQKKLMELEQEKKVREALDKERTRSDESYAIKLTEKAVFAIIGLMGITVFGVLVKLALDYIGRALQQ